MTGLPGMLTLEEFEAQVKDIIAPPFRSKFGAVAWRDLDAPGPEHEWLIKGVLTRNERSMVAGPSQSGKSFLVIDMALSIARGIPWMGRRTTQGGVIYQAGEGGKGIKKRLRAYRKFHGISLDEDIPFVLLPRPVDLYSGDDQSGALIEEIQHWRKSFKVPLELVVIDTFSAATAGADENSSKDVGPVLARCEKIAEACQCSVMLVHHMNSEGSKPRGHTSIFANLDNVITVKKVDGASDADQRLIREAVVTKQKDGEDGAKFRFVLPAVEIGMDADGDPVTSCVVAAPNTGNLGDVDTSKEAGVRLTVQAEVFLRAVHLALDDHGEPPPPEAKLPSSIRSVVNFRHVRDQFTKMTAEADGLPETAIEERAEAIRKALSRHGGKLVSLQIIGRANPWIWLTGKKVRGFRAPGDAAKERASAAISAAASEPVAGFDDDIFGGT